MTLVKKNPSYTFISVIILSFIFSYGCDRLYQKTQNNQSKILNYSTLEKDTILNINDDQVFKHIKEKFVFSDSAAIPTIAYASKQEFKEFLYSEWLDNDRLILLTSEYNKPNRFLIFNTKHKQITDTIVLTELFKTCGYISSPTNIHGLSNNKDYFIFSCGGYGYSSGVYKLLGYDLNKRKVYNIENFIDDKDLVFKKTGELLSKDGREYSFLPSAFEKYGKFSFTNNNGFQIVQSTTNYKDKNYDQQYLTTIKFPSLQSIINKKNDASFPVIESKKMSDQKIEKQLYFSNYYDRLPIILKHESIYNTPRKNTMFGTSSVIIDKESPYLFLPFVYALNPNTHRPRFEKERNENMESLSSKSNNKQMRYTGLLVNDKETNKLIKVFVHGIGVQGTYKRNGNFIITSIFSDYGDNHLVVWDIIKLKPIARLHMGRNTNYINVIFFDEKNKQIIGIHSNPAKVFVWNYYPE